jgi:hypothetical protein
MVSSVLSCKSCSPCPISAVTPQGNTMVLQCFMEAIPVSCHLPEPAPAPHWSSSPQFCTGHGEDVPPSPHSNFAVHYPLIHPLISYVAKIIFGMESLLLCRFLALTSISSPLAIAERHQTARSPSLSLCMWLISLSSLSWSSLITWPWGRAHDHLQCQDAAAPLLACCYIYAARPASVSCRRCRCWLRACHHESPMWATNIPSIFYVDPYCEVRTLVHIWLNSNEVSTRTCCCPRGHQRCCLLTFMFPMI